MCRHLRIEFLCLVFLFSVSLPASAQNSTGKAWITLQTALSGKTDEKVIAVRVLGLLQNDSKATDLALAALGDEKPEVRTAAAEALGQMGARSAASKLEETIKNEKE